MGYLPTTIRLRIEEQFRKPGGLRTLFCTSTLLEGVNLPADNLFVTHYNKGGKPMEAIDFKNLIGRVGRIQYNLYGNVYLVCLDQTVNQTEYFTCFRRMLNRRSFRFGVLLQSTKNMWQNVLCKGTRNWKS